MAMLLYKSKNMRKVEFLPPSIFYKYVLNTSEHQAEFYVKRTEATVKFYLDQDPRL